MNSSFGALGPTPVILRNLEQIEKAFVQRGRRFSETRGDSVRDENENEDEG